jgi:hypothetical protein
MSSSYTTPELAQPLIAVLTQTPNNCWSSFWFDARLGRKYAKWEQAEAVLSPSVRSQDCDLTNTMHLGNITRVIYFTCFGRTFKRPVYTGNFRCDFLLLNDVKELVSYKCSTLWNLITTLMSNLLFHIVQKDKIAAKIAGVSGYIDSKNQLENLVEVLVVHLLRTFRVIWYLPYSFKRPNLGSGKLDGG